MNDAVNALLHLGKGGALAAVEDCLARCAGGSVDGVFLVLRVLFEVPADPGFQPPLQLGDSTPCAPPQPQALPFFPLLLVDDRPLLLVAGYVLGGLAEPVRSHLDEGSLLPLDLPAPLDALRRRDATLRNELERELSSGAPLREAQALAPLLAAHDGVSIAAAAVRLLERERAVAQLRRAAFVAPAAPASAPAERGERAPRSGGPSARDDRGARPPRGKFGDRDAGAPRDRNFASRDDRGERPPRAKFGDRPSGPPRGGKFADRGPRPPRAGGKFPDRGERPSSGPRGPVRGSRGPAEGGDRAEWTDRGEQLRRAKKPPREE